MKVLVAVKRVIDPYVRVRVAEDGSGVITKNAKMAMNPFDEIALEQAIQLKEAGIATQIIIAAIGNDNTQETLRKGLAMGADKAIHVNTNSALQPLAVAKVLHKIVSDEQPQLILLGKQSISGDNNQTGQMLAALLDWPQATFISDLAIEADIATVCREIDGGLETLSLTLPAVMTADLRLNEPRYASLPSIMKAKNKPLSVLTLEDLKLTLKDTYKVTTVSPPVARTPGVILKDVATLIDKLKHEAKVLS